MREWTLHVETSEGVGSDALLEKFADELEKTAALGPAVSMTRGAIGATFQIEAETADDAGEIGSGLFMIALARAAIGSNVHTGSDAYVHRLAVEAA